MLVLWWKSGRNRNSPLLGVSPNVTNLTLAINIINKLCARPSRKSPWKMLIAKQCLFRDNIKVHLKRFNLIWHLLRGITMWTIWIEINDLVFNMNFWFVHQMEFIACNLLVESMLGLIESVPCYVDWKCAMFMICRALEIRRLPCYSNCKNFGHPCSWFV